MKRVITAISALCALALSAEAQSYTCVDGELAGGAAGVAAKCTTNALGQITSVTPYQPQARQSVKIYPQQQTQTLARSAPPVRNYTPTGNRAYAPTPLVPLSRPPAKVIPAAAQTIETRSSNVRVVSPNGNAYYGRPVSYTAANTAPAAAHVQITPPGAYCDFKVREVRVGGNANVYEVCHSDLNLNSRRSVRRLYSRVQKASNRACGTDYDSILTRWGRDNRSCVSASVDRTVASSGLEPLRAYHFARTGRRGTPTVYVGAPRDAY